MLISNNQEFVQKNYALNSFLYIGEGFFSAVWNNLTFLYVLLFINWNWAQYKNLGAEKVSSNFLGYFQTIVSTASFISLFLMIVFSEDLPRKKPVVLVFGILKRSGPVLFAFATWLLPSNIRIYAVVTISIILYVSCSDGVPWRIMNAKVIPVEKRGRVEAWRNMAARIGGLLGLFFAIQVFSPGNTWFFKKLTGMVIGLTDIEQARYFFFFSVISTSGIMSFIILSFTREPKDDAGPGAGWKRLLFEKTSQMAVIIAKNLNFRRFLFFTLLAGFSDLMTLGYAAIFVSKFLGFGESVWGELNIISIIIGINAVFRYGKQGDGNGWKIVVVRVALYLSVVPLLFIFMAYTDLPGINKMLSGFSIIYQTLIGNTRNMTLFVLCFAFSLVGMLSNSFLMARTCLALEFTSDKQQTSYLGVTSLTQQAGSIIAGLLVGAFIDKLGLPGIIVIGLVLQLTSVVYAHFYLQEPRKLYKITDEMECGGNENREECRIQAR